MRLVYTLALTASLLAGCATTREGQTGPAAERDIAAALAASAEAWNRGDLEGHVAMYADSAAFMTASGPVIGRARTADALRQAYFLNGSPVQQLRFESVAVRPVGAAHALVTGHFILSGGGQPDATGWFTTLWAHGPDGWRVVHDHSS